MAQQEGGRLPGGMGGLVQYYDEYDEPFQFHPRFIVGFISFFAFFILMLHVFRPL